MFYILVSLNKQYLTGKDCTPGCQAIESEEFRKVHLVSPGNYERRIPFQDFIIPGLHPCDNRRGPGYFKCLTDSQMCISEPVNGLYGLGRCPESLGYPPE